MYCYLFFPLDLLVLLSIFKSFNIEWVYIYDCYVFLVNYLFITVEWLSLSLVTVLDVKCILSYISVATPVLFWFPLAWDVFFYHFTLSLCMSLELKWHSCSEHRVFFQLSCAFWLENLNPFTFRVISDRWGFTNASY